MSKFEKYVELTRRKYPQYKFSWEILTELVLENIADRPYWLDIGAGKNIWINEQPGAAFSVGLDIAKSDGLRIDHATGGYVIADSANLPFKNESFGFITSRYTFEHLEDPEKTLWEIGRVLQSNGKFIMQTTNKTSPQIIFSRMIPYAIKRRLFTRIFGEDPSGTFRTYYKLNRPDDINPNYGALELKEIILLEDLLCQTRLFYRISLLIYRFLNLFRLDNFRNNIIVIFKKK